MPYKFYPSDGASVDVEPERWSWEAHYNDGSILKQFDSETGLFHQFKEIDQERLSTFQMVYTHTPRYVSKPKYIIHWRPGYKLIHFYRNAVLDNGQRHIRLYCFGYQYYELKCIMVILPDDSVIITEDVDTVKIR